MKKYGARHASTTDIVTCPQCRQSLAHLGVLDDESGELIDGSVCMHMSCETFLIHLGGMKFRIMTEEDWKMLPDGEPDRLNKFKRNTGTSWRPLIDAQNETMQRVDAKISEVATKLDNSLRLEFGAEVGWILSVVSAKIPLLPNISTISNLPSDVLNIYLKRVIEDK